MNTPYNPRHLATQTKPNQLEPTQTNPNQPKPIQQQAVLPLGQLCAGGGGAPLRLGPPHRSARAAGGRGAAGARPLMSSGSLLCCVTIDAGCRQAEGCLLQCCSGFRDVLGCHSFSVQPKAELRIPALPRLPWNPFRIPQTPTPHPKTKT